MTTWLSLVTALGLVIPLVLYALHRFLQGSTCRSKERLEGRTVIITGGNTGIGKETAIDLARRGARVYIACRDHERGELALTEIKEKSASNNIYFMLLDLASFASIRTFAEEFLSREKRLHVLINNAGVMMCPLWRTEEGFEMQLGVNHLGHFLLTRLLIERLKESAPSRIVNVSSLAHHAGSINFGDLQSKESYSSFAAYAQSKLANVLFTGKLSQLLEGSGVSVFSLHPGSVNTDLGRHFETSWYGVVYTLIYPLILFGMKTAKQGAQTNIYCAVQPGIEGNSGKYFADCKVAPSRYDEGMAEKLWEASEDACNVTFTSSHVIGS